MELHRHKSGGFAKLLRDVKEGSEEFVEVGWFKEQGQHYSGLSYPDLAKVHRNGVQVPKRDILGILLFLHSPKNDPTVKRLLRKWVRKKEFTAKDLFLSLGRRERKLLMSVFGHPQLGITSNPTPLVDTGDWKSKTVFKFSVTGLLLNV